MKGESMMLNGDLWTIVDVAPAPELAEMVAAILEEEGFVALTKSPDHIGDALTSLGSSGIGTTYVLVPQDRAEEALELIAATVTDYEGDSLEALLADMNSAETEPNAASERDDTD